MQKVVETIREVEIPQKMIMDNTKNKEEEIVPTKNDESLLYFISNDR